MTLSENIFGITDTFEREKLAEYLEHGLLLELNNPDTIDNYIMSAIVAKKNIVTLIGKGFYPGSHRMIQQSFPQIKSLKFGTDILSINFEIYRIVNISIFY